MRFTASLRLLLLTGEKHMYGLNKITLALATAGLLSSGAVQAALNDRGGGLIYDTDRNITWLSDANYAATQFTATGGIQGDADGKMNWSAANSWAANLSYGGYSDWRLATSDTCWGDNCTGSELGHLFYTELGGTAGNFILSSSDPNLALFSNVLPEQYWSGTAYAPNQADFAWGFRMGIGQQRYDYQYHEFYAWAVRDGDVAAPIPEPETYAMLLAGLGFLGFMAKRRKQQAA